MPASGSPSTIIKKTTIVETSSPQAANAVFTGSWHDSQVDGTIYVMVRINSDQNGSILVQLSDDISNNSFSENGDPGSVAYSLNTLHHYPTYIRCRYWRVIYTNGATASTKLEITSCAFNQWLGSVSTGQGAESAVGSLVVQPTAGAGAETDNNIVGGVRFVPTNGATGQLSILEWIYGGGFSATADLVRQGWSKARTATVFKQKTTAATGSTAVWTPGAGNKFRLLKYRIIVDASAIMAVATDLTISLLDAALDIAQDYIVRIPAAALGSGVNYDTGWVDLGQFGILSAAANNVLNINLNAALTGGLVNILVAGTEE